MKDEHAHQGHGDALDNTHDYKEWIVNEQLTNSILILGKLSASGEKTPDMPNLSQCFNDGQHHESPVVPRYISVAPNSKKFGKDARMDLPGSGMFM